MKPSAVELRHLNEVPWWEAPIPARWHRCRPQTVGWINYPWAIGGPDLIERCACGAIRRKGRWMGRNARRKK